jgi:hypothetical protein
VSKEEEKSPSSITNYQERDREKGDVKKARRRREKNP